MMVIVEIPPDVVRLPVGDPPAAPYAVGRSIVLPSGTVELDPGYRSPYSLGLGGSDAGVVAETDTERPQRRRVRLHIAADGTTAEIDTGWSPGHRTSPDGRHAVWTTGSPPPDSPDQPAAVLLADVVRGTVVVHRELTNVTHTPWVYDFDGVRAFLVQHLQGGDQYTTWEPLSDRLEQWQTPPGITSILAGSLAADTVIGRGRDTDGVIATTSLVLSAPSVRRWRDRNDHGRAWVSPAGTHYARDIGAGFVLRELATNRLVARYELTGEELPDTGWVDRTKRADLRRGAVAWEPAGDLLTFVRRGREQREYLLRCPLAGDSLERVLGLDEEVITAVST